MSPVQTAVSSPHLTLLPPLMGGAQGKQYGDIYRRLHGMVSVSMSYHDTDTIKAIMEVRCFQFVRIYP